MSRQFLPHLQSSRISPHLFLNDVCAQSEHNEVSLLNPQLKCVSTDELIAMAVWFARTTGPGWPEFTPARPSLPIGQGNRTQQAAIPA